MTTSTLLSRLYQEPSPPSSLSNTRLMQTLHLRHDLAPTAITAPGEFYCSKPAASCPYSLAPYLHRVFWVLTTTDGQFLANINGTAMQFVHTANDVPPAHRFSSFERAKSVWVQLSELLPSQDCSMVIRPVDFYAHRSTPNLWCACDD
jgi:hypothetical protein